MLTEYCGNCRAERGFKRNLGWGTFFAAVLTAGCWIFLIPFYPKRCIICGNKKENILFKPVFASKTREPQKVYMGSDAWDHLRGKDNNDDSKKCPFCAELVKKEAIKCRHCGSSIQLPPSVEIPEATTDEKPSPSTTPTAENYNCKDSLAYMVGQDLRKLVHRQLNC